MQLPIITWEDDSRQPILAIVVAVLLTLSLTTVSLRFYCRMHLVSYVGLDDYFIAVAMCVAVALGIMSIFHVSYGTGLHLSDLPSDPALSLIPTLKYWYAFQIVYPITLFFVKASFLALYIRIFTASSLPRLHIYIVAGIVVVYTVTVMFVNAFECHSNVSHAWHIDFPKGCNSLPRMYFSQASINIITDIIILLMPIRPITQLKINARKRMVLVGIFCVGGIAISASCVRLYSLWLYLTSDDVSYDAIFILIFSQIEINLAIICASVPSLRPLFAKVLGSAESYGHSNDYRHGRNTDGGSNFKMSRPNDMHEYQSFCSNAKTLTTVQREERDSNSEELILGGEITVMRTVEMSYSEDSRKSSRG